MLEYLKKHIVDELSGAIDYMTKALEHKGTNCGTKFYHMALTELEHANELVKMYTGQERPKGMTDAEYSELYRAILDSYSTHMGKNDEKAHGATHAPIILSSYLSYTYSV